MENLDTRYFPNHKEEVCYNYQKIDQLSPSKQYDKLTLRNRNHSSIWVYGFSAMKRCSNCILTECTPKIQFNEKNICIYCETHQKIEYRGENKLLKILHKYRGRGKKYDCIVTLSGGRDSTFTLLKLVKDYKMKVLAVNYENPFTDPQARLNMRNAVNILNVDFVSFKSKNRIHQRSFKHNLKTWLKNPDVRIITYFCIGCKSLWWDILKIARRYNVRLIVSGMNRFEDTSFKKALLGIPITEKWETTYMKSFFTAITGLAGNPRYLQPGFIPTMIKAYLFGDPYAIGPRVFAGNVTKIDLFFYIKWAEKDIISRLKSELYWDSPKNTASTWRFDCKVAHLKDLIYSETLGVTERDDFYSKMIREGLISRSDALDRAEIENYHSKEIAKELLREANIEYVAFRKALDKARVTSNPQA